MAECPKCKSSISWIKLLALDNHNEIECQHCHAKLRMDRKRATEIGGLFFLLAVIPLIPGLNIEVSYWWIVLLIPPFIIIWVKFVKLKEVTESVSVLTKEEEGDLKLYVAKRKKTDFVLLSIVLLSMATWLFDAFVLNSQINELVLVAIILVMFVCVVSMYFTRCPFCKKITPNIQNVKTCRYCKKNIN